MKLYTYFRSSAAYRVRIAPATSRASPTTAIPVHLLRDGGEQLQPAYRAVNPSALVPALRRRRRHPDAVAGDPRIPRRDAPRRAAAAARCAGPGPRARAGADDRLRHPSADEPARAEIPEKHAGAVGRGQAGVVPPLDGRGTGGARGAAGAGRPGRHAACSAMATARRWPTAAWCRRYSMRSASPSTWRRIRAWRASTRIAPACRRLPPRIRRSSLTPNSLHAAEGRITRLATGGFFMRA